MPLDPDFMPLDPDFIVMHVLREAAPEKAMLLEDEFKAKPLSCLFDLDEHLVYLSCDTTRKEIVIGIVGIVRLWALAYCYLHIWDKILEKITENPEGGEYGVDFGSAEIDLLNWAMLCELNATQKRLREDPWFNEIQWLKLLPDDAPFPMRGEVSEDFTGEVTKLWCSALGFLLHHKFAHIRRNHRSTEGSFSTEEEKVADRDSAEWIVGGLDQEQDKFKQRGIGIALALLWLAVIEVYTGPIASKSHPAGFERLYLILEHFVLDPRHLIWAFTSTVLQIHTASREGYDPAKRPHHETPKEDVIYFLSLIRNSRIE